MEHLPDGLPEVVRIQNNINPAVLGVDTNGTVMAYALDGMSCSPVQSYDRIIKVPKEEQLRLLATAYKNVLREIAMGSAKAHREFQSMAALASGMAWKEPNGKACGPHHAWISAEEAVRFLIIHPGNNP